MTHIAVLSGKYEQVLYNDVQPNLVGFMQDIINGRYNHKVFTPEFVTKDRFFAEKENDAYIKYVWSFSGNGINYLFSTSIERTKQSIHNYVVYGVIDEILKKDFPQIELTETTLNGRRQEWRKQVNKYAKETAQRECLTRLEQLERLKRLEGLEVLAQSGIVFTCMDYREYEYMDGDIVYCDIPYENSARYTVNFNHEEFYEWASTRPYDVYMSSYSGLNDDRFTLIWSKAKRNLMKGTITKTVNTEALYVNHAVIIDVGHIMQEQKQLSVF